MRANLLGCLWPWVLGVLMPGCERASSDRLEREPSGAPAAVPAPIRAPEAAPAPAEITAPAAILLHLTNAERARAGVGPLRASGPLMRAAQLQAEQVARTGRLEHVLTGVTYPRPEDRLAAAGYLWQAFAENLAAGDADASHAMAGWMRSRTHRTNVLNSAYTELGTAVAHDAAGRLYYVQVFGRPAR
jgi:uncharacterized protein YkwD